ncbi:MAG TPA: helix-hairpin-helix domain-containing protein, partial [Nitrososphaera sp.]|nr:helix-hairpin-helix domain-containing protein [Nitrososphaera sp.]
MLQRICSTHARYQLVAGAQEKFALREDDSSKLALGSIEDIGPATEKRLKEAGFRSIKDLLVRGPVDVAEATGMEMDEAVEMCNKARVALEDLGVIDRSFVTATSLYEK